MVKGVEQARGGGKFFGKERSMDVCGKFRGGGAICMWYVVQTNLREGMSLLMIESIKPCLVVLVRRHEHYRAIAPEQYRYFTVSRAWGM